MTSVEELLKEAHRLWRNGEEFKATKVLEEACKLAEFGDKGKLLEILNEYGGALRVIGDYKKAIFNLDKAKKLCEIMSIEGSESYATTLMNLANVYREDKDYVKAEDLFKESKAIYETLKINNYSYIGLLNNYSLLCKQINNYEKASTMQKAAINLLEKDEKFRVPLAISLNNLYEIESIIDKSSAPSKYLYRAETIIKKDLGEEHPLYAAILNNIAKIKYKEGNFEEAINLYNKALNIVEVKYGNNSSAYKSILSNIEFMKKSKPKKGLDVAKELSNKVENLIARDFPSLYSGICIGLVGKGSECYGFDDEISKDHDYVDRVMLFLSQKDFIQYKEKLKSRFEEVFKETIEIWSIGNFYKYYTSFEEGPRNIYEFRKVSEEYLSTATNGEVFIDNLGKFSYIRERLLRYYPKDLKLKFLILSLNKMAQSGQYNFPRLIKRKDYVAANFALNEFIENFIYFVHIINNKYMPFYKWRYKNCTHLSVLGDYAKDSINKLLSSNMEEKTEIINDIVKDIIFYLKSSDLSNIDIDFLTYQALEVSKNIDDIKVKELDMWKR